MYLYFLQWHTITVMFYGAKWFSVERHGYLSFEYGFCAGKMYFFCGLWWFLLHSAIAFTMIFFLQGNLFNAKNVPAMFFGWRKAWLQNNQAMLWVRWFLGFLWVHVVALGHMLFFGSRLSWSRCTFVTYRSYQLPLNRGRSSIQQ